MSSQPKKTKPKAKASLKKSVVSSKSSASIWLFIAPILTFTFLLFLPMLKNGFTNWDDILYVTQNPLLKNLSLEGIKAIFSTPVVSNYHPLTILSLALNYQVGELSPTSYWVTNIILHVINTGLVFWFIYLLSSRNQWISGFVALLFAIHPMHVESVAWVSERKDLLYTLFYVAAMILYIKYVDTSKIIFLVITTLLGAISLLCKPAAIVLPLSLLLIDFYKKRTWNIKWILEKIPLFIFCALMAYVTLQIQAKRAIASTELYSIMDRFFFAGFGWIWYLLKIIFPFPLSALHPFPHELTPWYYLATAAAIGFVIYSLLKIKNRNFLFGFGFYTVNLLLVLQIISIGNAVVAERYTYVPYIGIFFWIAMEGHKALQGRLASYKAMLLSIMAILILAFSWMSFTHISTWTSSQVLWQNVLDHYPDSKRAWTNKGLDFYDQKKYPEVIDHLSRALALDSNYVDALEWRSRAYLEMQDGTKALPDALHFLKLKPDTETGLFLAARAYAMDKQYDRAISLYNVLTSKQNKPEYFNNRGAIYFNGQKQYELAKKDFEKAIELNPKTGNFYLNLSRCYYMLGDNKHALNYASQARDLGEPVDPSYANVIGLQLQ